MRRQMIFNKLKQKIHNLRPSVRKERIRLEAKQEILSVISNELGLDVDGDFCCCKSSGLSCHVLCG